MDRRRILISIAVPFFLFIIRWMIVTIGHRAFPSILGQETAAFDGAKTVGLLGWDFASVGLGLYISAVLSAESVLSVGGGNRDPTEQNLRILFSLMIFAALYFPAVFVRFCLLENWRKLLTVHRVFYGLVSWVLGFAIMGSTSALAVKATLTFSAISALIKPTQPWWR